MKAIVLFLCVMALAASHHVVFEDVGEIVTSITYIHVAIPLNLTGIRNLAHHFGNAITLTSDPRMHFHKNIGDDHYKRTYWDDNYIRLLERERTGQRSALRSMQSRYPAGIFCGSLDVLLDDGQAGAAPGASGARGSKDASSMRQWLAAER